MMYQEDALQMIANNEKSLAALQSIAARNPSLMLDRVIADRAETIEAQRDPSNFSMGGQLYFSGARAASSEKIAEAHAEIFFQRANVRICKMAEALRSRLGVA